MAWRDVPLAVRLLELEQRGFIDIAYPHSPDEVARWLVDDDEPPSVPELRESGWLPPAVKGEVGAIEGPPIVGTNDRVNSGVARRSRAVSGEVIEPETPDATIAWPRWQPAGEVGIVIGADASVVEDPKNDARPLQRQLVEGYAIPEGWTAGRVGLCRSCKAAIMWATTPKGMAAPIDADGTSHFATCPQADQWRRKP